MDLLQLQRSQLTQQWSYDIRNALKLSSTYALPFGKNQAFLSNGKFLNYFVGGWTAGMITIYQSGAPILLTGGLSSTINPPSDGGVSFVGTTTAQDIQHSVHVTKSGPRNPFVNLIGPRFQGASAANASYVGPNKTPGVEGNLPYIYGPKWNNFDLSATKDIPIFDGGPHQRAGHIPERLQPSGVDWRWLQYPERNLWNHQCPCPGSSSHRTSGQPYLLMLEDIESSQR